MRRSMETPTPEQLQARIRRLEAALRATTLEIDALTYSIAHDLRTPLMHVDGFAHLLQSSPGAVLDAESRDFLERIIGAAGTMAGLIGGLVEYSRVNSAEMFVTEVDLERLLDAVLDELRPSTAGRNIQWQRSRLPSVRGDEGLLRQVLMNLAANAIKYTAAREPAVIEIGSRPEQDGVTVFVRDNGVGFDMKYATRLFSPFQRMHAAGEFKGLGVGLAKVRRIVARHGGQVRAEAGVGGGAAFYFTLPSDVVP